VTCCFQERTEKSSLLQTFIEIMKYWKRDSQWDKVSSSFRKENLDTNIPTALALSAMIILSILCDFSIIQLLKIVIILKIRRLHQVKQLLQGFDFLFWGFVTDHWFVSLIFQFFPRYCKGHTSITKLSKIGIILSSSFQIITINI
jgi:hypothetical protein